MPDTTTDQRTAADQPTIGALVEVRGQRWVVSHLEPADGSAEGAGSAVNGVSATGTTGGAGTVGGTAVVTGGDAAATGDGSGSLLVRLQSVEDGRYGDTLDVIWDVEPGRRVLPGGTLPDVTPDGYDRPRTLAAFLDAVRWSAVTSADVKTLQAPFRSGVAIEDYQLEPVARAVDAPRVNLLLADDVGLGKTIEAGLVAQELLLRHRARRVMIVCPAGLTVKWRDEMADKFGLEFTVIDTAECARVRRTHGSAANPFMVHPLCIVSLPWLRGQKAQRLLDEVLPPGGPGTRRTFDLLILDEAHHAAPAAPKQVYAVDSQQTKLIRRLAPHFTHRLFLSATPHNGYQASFTALLEILDPQRFARGVEPDRAAVSETVVRRLKRDIVNPDGTPRFVARQPAAIPVEYPPEERAVHDLLKEFAAARRERLTTRRGRRATDLVTLLLKKRLFSSPAAFAHTVSVYAQTLRARRSGSAGQAAPGGQPGQSAVDDDIPEWMRDFLDDTATYDDLQLAEAEDHALDRVRPMQPDPTDPELALLERMEQWAVTHEARPDAKAHALITYLRGVCQPDGHNWTNERVVVFTEYRDTLRWLVDLLRQEGLGGDRVAQLHGETPADEREQIRLAFQADPTGHPVRILLATDAASEGIDLQNHCHRLVNYDIPFNPNKLEQRIGRIDRYGQRTPTDVRHFVGTGWGRAVDSYEADLEFLSRVATKVARMEEDLGSVNAVLSETVQRRMLGDTTVDNVESTAAPATADLPAESNVREQVRRLRANIEETVAELGITPESVKRVVDTALELARQQPLRPYVDDREPVDGLYEVPPLTGSWQRAAAGLTERLRRDDQPPRQLPVTFDHRLTVGREDVVLAHLGHPLVTMPTRLLRAAASNDSVGLHRVTAVVSDDPALEDVLVGAYSRFVLVGADGVRLHEEVLYAGGWAPEQGRFRRLENLTTLGGFLHRALADGTPAPPTVLTRLAARWQQVRGGLLAAIEWRTAARRESLDRKLTQRRQAEQARVVENLDRFAASLRSALAEDPDGDGDALFTRAQLEKSPDELAQYRRDREAWGRRLAGLADERDRELAAIEARYHDPRPHSFPVAVVVVVPRHHATR